MARPADSGGFKPRSPTGAGSNHAAAAPPGEGDDHTEGTSSRPGKLVRVNRFTTLAIAIVLALVVCGCGIVNNAADLLMVAPFVLILIPLLAGLYPAESAIEALHRQLTTEPSAYRAEQASPVFPDPHRFIDTLVCGTLGSRGPPSLAF